jgi:hypothetical protein
MESWKLCSSRVVKSVAGKGSSLQGRNKLTGLVEEGQLM